MADDQMKIGKIGEKVVKAYKAIEDGVVGTYQKIEDGVVGAYQKVEDAFVETFMEKKPEDKSGDKAE